MSYRQKSIKELFYRFNLDSSCSKTELRNEYLRKARRLHPDTSQNDSSKFVEMKEDYEAALRYIHSRESIPRPDASRHEHTHTHTHWQNTNAYHHDAHYKYNYYSSGYNWAGHTANSYKREGSRPGPFSEEVKQWEKWVVYSVSGLFVYIMYQALWPRKVLSPTSSLQDMTLRQAHDAMRMRYKKSELQAFELEDEKLEEAVRYHENFYKQRVMRSTVKNGTFTSPHTAKESIDWEKPV